MRMGCTGRGETGEGGEKEMLTGSLSLSLPYPKGFVVVVVVVVLFCFLFVVVVVFFFGGGGYFTISLGYPSSAPTRLFYHFFFSYY